MAERLPALTSLRFLAALAVIAHHVAGFTPGHGGVSLFFTLSGFVIARSYGDRVRSTAQILSFWKGRARRILPSHWICLVLAAPLAVTDFGTVIANVLLLQSWSADPHVYFGLNSVSWSLSAEAFFYLCFPVLVGIRPRQVVIAAAAVALLATWAALAGLDDAAQHAIFYINPLLRLPEFMAGIALARANNLPSPTAGFTAVFVAATLGLVWLTPHTPISSGLAFLPAAVVLVAYAANQRQGWLTDSRLVVAGEASFTLYITAHLCQRYMHAWFGLSHVADIASAALALGLSLAWYYREDIARRIGRLTPQHLPSP